MHILLAEDEPMIGQLLAMILKGDGYIVDLVEDGDAALEACRKQHRGYDLLITDLSMPGLSGLALAREVKAMRPTQKVALMTGSIGDPKPSEDIDYVFSKPVDFDALKQVLADLKG